MEFGPSQVSTQRCCANADGEPRDVQTFMWLRIFEIPKLFIPLSVPPTIILRLEGGPDSWLVLIYTSLISCNHLLTLKTSGSVSILLLGLMIDLVRSYR